MHCNAGRDKTMICRQVTCMIKVLNNFHFFLIQPIQYVEGANDKSWVKAARKDLRRNGISVGTLSTNIIYTRKLILYRNIINWIQRFFIHISNYDHDGEMIMNLPERCGLIPFWTAPQIFPFQVSKDVVHRKKNNFSQYDLIGFLLGQFETTQKGEGVLNLRVSIFVIECKTKFMNLGACNISISQKMNSSFRCPCLLVPSLLGLLIKL